MNLSVSRRQFLKAAACASAAAVTPFMIVGCAVDPVTGKQQLMMVSRDQEIAIDRQQSPFQFSSDYGVSQDAGLNRYVSDVGRALLPHVHRPLMPYDFKCVNATYINAYAFPGGSITVTRGILLKLENEAELASLLGHELGHVNARHTAEQMSKGQLSSLLVGGLSAAAGTQGGSLGELTQTLGALGQGLLLSKYSRDNEREADALGNQYMVKAGYPSRGFVQLMQMLDSLHKEQPSSAQILFSTHPMSSERLASAVQREKGIYAYTHDFNQHRERYMDHTASLRRQKQGIALLQEGEKQMAKKEYGKAKELFNNAVKKMPEDYTAYVLLAKASLVGKETESARSFATTAQKLYPSESQGYFIGGLASVTLNRFDEAYNDFDTCDRLLPGNPQMVFYKGYCMDKKGKRNTAAPLYMTYLKQINYQPNTYSKYAYGRLKAWGYAK